MIEQTDFSHDDAERKLAQDNPPAPAQSPVIVIEYRHRGLAARLMPPALILLAAVAVSSYQRKTPVRRLSTPPRLVVEPSAHATPKIRVRAGKRVELAEEAAKKQEPSTAADSSGPVEKAAVPVAIAMVVEPEPARARSPFDLEPSEGLRPLDSPADPRSEVPPRPVDVAPAEKQFSPPPAPAAGELEAAGEPPRRDDPEVTKDEILMDIQREADQKNAHRQDLEDLKPRARALVIAEEIAKVQSDRIAFRNELKLLMKSLGPNAGPEIDRLCEQYGREMLAEVRAAYFRALRIAPTRMKSHERVELLRTLGIPEPVILDYLCNGLHKTMNTRGGPRDENEVRVLGARALINLQVKAAAKPAPAAARPVAAVRPGP
jgi:hypothetical protein